MVWIIDLVCFFTLDCFAGVSLFVWVGCFDCLCFVIAVVCVVWCLVFWFAFVLFVGVTC